MVKNIKGNGELVRKTEENNNEKEEILRINISRLGDTALLEGMEQVNDGFIGGKVNKTQMLNWILKRFKDDLDESIIKDIRADHFDEVAVLELILRKARETGKVPSEFKHLLQKQVGLEILTKKKAKQALTGNGINGDMEESDK
ncbi:MAG: hypothetical protein Q7U04_14290 [Bacteriovorax sp.]|nr:hypothetical protein [Bacteriovorax sp.]